MAVLLIIIAEDPHRKLIEFFVVKCKSRTAQCETAMYPAPVCCLNGKVEHFTKNKPNAGTGLLNPLRSFSHRGRPIIL